MAAKTNIRKMRKIKGKTVSRRHKNRSRGRKNRRKRTNSKYHIKGGGVIESELQVKQFSSVDPSNFLRRKDGRSLAATGLVFNYENDGTHISCMNKDGTTRFNIKLSDIMDVKQTIDSQSRYKFSINPIAVAYIILENDTGFAAMGHTANGFNTDEYEGLIGYDYYDPLPNPDSIERGLEKIKGQVKHGDNYPHGIFLYEPLKLVDTIKKVIKSSNPLVPFQWCIISYPHNPQLVFYDSSNHFYDQDTSIEYYIYYVPLINSKVTYDDFTQACTITPTGWVTIYRQSIKGKYRLTALDPLLPSVQILCNPSERDLIIGISKRYTDFNQSNPQTMAILHAHGCRSARLGDVVKPNTGVLGEIYRADLQVEEDRNREGKEQHPPWCVYMGPKTNAASKMMRPSYEDHIDISGKKRDKKTTGQKLESLVPIDIVPCACRGRFCKGEGRNEKCWRFVGIDMTYKLKKQMERIEKNNLTHERDTAVTSLVLRATPVGQAFDLNGILDNRLLNEEFLEAIYTTYNMDDQSALMDDQSALMEPFLYAQTTFKDEEEAGEAKAKNFIKSNNLQGEHAQFIEETTKVMKMLVDFGDDISPLGRFQGNHRGGSKGTTQQGGAATTTVNILALKDDNQYCCALVERVTNWILHLSSFEETSRDYSAMRYLNIYLNAHVIISRLYDEDGTYNFDKFYSMLKFLEQKDIEEKIQQLKDPVEIAKAYIDLNKIKAEQQKVMSYLSEKDYGTDDWTDDETDETDDDTEDGTDRALHVSDLDGQNTDTDTESLHQEILIDSTERYFEEPGNYTYGNRLYDAAAKVHDACYFLLRGHSRVLAVDTDRGAVKLGKDVNAFDTYYSELLTDILTFDVKGLLSKVGRELNPAVWRSRAISAKQTLGEMKQSIKELLVKMKNGEEEVNNVGDTVKDQLVHFVAECVVSDLQRLTLKAVLSLKSEGEEISVGLGIIKRFFQNFTAWNEIYNDLKKRPEVLTNLYIEFNESTGRNSILEMKMREIMEKVCRSNTIVNYDRGPQGRIFRFDGRPLNDSMNSINNACRSKFDPTKDPKVIEIMMVEPSDTVWDAVTGYGEAPINPLHKTTVEVLVGNMGSNLLGKQEYEHWVKVYKEGGHQNAHIPWGEFCDETMYGCSPRWTSVVEHVRLMCQGHYPQDVRHLHDVYYFYNQDKLSNIMCATLFPTDSEPREPEELVLQATPVT